MMSRASSNKFHPALNLYRYSVKRTSGVTVLITVFLLLFCPGYTVIHINDAVGDVGVYNFDRLSSSLIIAVIAVTTCAALLYLFINFAYLYGRSSSDFFHALPLKRRGLLFSRFAASLVPLIVPLILTYSSMAGILLLDNVSGSLRPIISGFLFNVIIILACSAFSMIFIVCAGSTFDLIISFLTFNIGIVFVQLILSVLCCEFLTGFPTDSTQSFLNYSTPFYYAIARVYEILTSKNGAVLMSVEFIINLALITAASLSAAYLLYKRRKSEKSGMGYAYKFVYTVCTVIVAVIGAYGLSIIFANGEYNTIFWIFTLVGGMLAAVTYGAINERGFKTVKKSLITGGASVLSLILICLILGTGGFGYTTKLPDSKNVKSVQVEFGGCEVTFEDPTLPLKLHSAIVEGIKSDGEEYDWYDTVSLDYTLKGGHKLSRSFNIGGKVQDILLEIFKSEENIKALKEDFDGMNWTGLNISVYGKNGDDGSYTAFITPLELKIITDAYIRDIPNSTVGMLSYDFDFSFEIQGIDADGLHQYRYFYVESGFKNTIEVLNSLDLRERVAEE